MMCWLSRLSWELSSQRHTFFRIIKLRIGIGQNQNLVIMQWRENFRRLFEARLDGGDLVIGLRRVFLNLL